MTNLTKNELVQINSKLSSELCTLRAEVSRLQAQIDALKPPAPKNETRPRIVTRYAVLVNGRDNKWHEFFVSFTRHDAQDLMARLRSHGHRARYEPRSAH